MVGVGALLIAALGILIKSQIESNAIIIKGQAENNAILGEVKRDVAVLSSETRRDREEMAELKGRVKTIEARLFEGQRQ